MEKRQQACPLPAGMVFFGIFGEVKIVHLIHEFDSRPYSTWVDRLRSRRGVTHDLCS